jgi:hypothetical protein
MILFAIIYAFSVVFNAFFITEVLSIGVPFKELVRHDRYNFCFVFMPFFNTVGLAIMLIMTVAAVMMDPYDFFRGEDDDRGAD